MATFTTNKERKDKQESTFHKHNKAKDSAFTKHKWKSTLGQSTPNKANKIIYKWAKPVIFTNYFRIEID